MVCYQLLFVWRAWPKPCPFWVDMDLWPVMPLDIRVTLVPWDALRIDLCLKGLAHFSDTPDDQSTSFYSLSSTQASFNKV